MTDNGYPAQQLSYLKDLCVPTSGKRLGEGMSSSHLLRLRLTEKPHFHPHLAI